MKLEIPHITFDRELKNACPLLRVGVLVCEIGAITEEGVEALLQKEEQRVAQERTMASIKELPAIASTRRCYKALGKDPNRYRPSSEQLMRRILSQGKLYRVMPLVDLGNVWSLKTGYSIGMFDLEKIYGAISYGVGTPGELYHGIQRGIVNIDRLPTYRDELSAFATPTTDEERTKITADTNKILIFINDFGSHTNAGERDPLREALRGFEKELSRLGEVYQCLVEIVD